MSESDVKIIASFCVDTKNSLKNLSECAKKLIITVSRYSLKNNKGNTDMAEIILKKLALKIVSWNVNGIRTRILSEKPFSKCKLGFQKIDPISNLGKIVTKYNPDILCFQETRCDEKIWGCINIHGYYQYWNCSKKKGARGSGYAGTSVWTKIKPLNVLYDLPTLKQRDMEGRILVLEYPSFVLINTYVPNAGTNFDYRVNEWDPAIQNYLAKLKSEKTNVIWCGDMNVARTPKDVHFGNPKSSAYTARRLSGTGSTAVAGFTKEERDGFEKILKEGYVDVFRELNPDTIDSFTWWNPRAKGNIFRMKNKGRRIDYFVINKELMKWVENMEIITDAGLETKPQGSDHAAIYLQLDRSFYN